MRKTLIVTVLTLAALSLSGCGCSRPFGRWFNRGDACETDPCATGGIMPRATVNYPVTIPPGAEILPGPANP
ncbi:MAG TPA: hypothetical protein VFB96_03070 [Pirellulaceae bacterium]|jgi:hypothetical protein|nr:hypothetical protein [Pirellulaceae bacterium]